MTDDVLVSLLPAARTLSADDMGIGVLKAAQESHGSTAPDAPLLSSNDPRVALVDRLSREYGGVIFTGPPGTGKSFLAAEAGRLIAGDNKRLRFVQFHASYQYEDFMYGYTPVKGGFEPRLGPFLEACQAADADRGVRHVIVIDELSRADVGRVFGEALTYVERSKRELEFLIASGENWKVPSNLVILATMNPQDRGVDEVDAAFERRFAKISMEPDPDALEVILAGNGVDAQLRQRIIGWFRRINGQARKNPTAAVGHAYFTNVVDEATLRDLWDYQLKFLVERAFRLDQNTRVEIENGWDHIFTSKIGEAQNETSDSSGGPVESEDQ